MTEKLCLRPETTGVSGRNVGRKVFSSLVGIQRSFFLNHFIDVAFFRREGARGVVMD